MKRDFSEAQKQTLLKMVQEVQPDGFFQNIGDWFGDRGLGIQKFFGSLDINKYLNDMDTYHKKMIDKDNISSNQIENIFNNVNNIDTTYKNNVNGNISLIDNLTSILNKYYSAIHTSNIDFCSQSALETIQSGTAYNKYKEKYIENFETAYPEYKDKMNEFLSPMQQTDQDNIKFIVYSSEEPYRSLFLDNVDGVKWGKTKPYNDGNEQKEFAFYSSFNRTINIDLTNEYALGSDPRGEYATFFHEFGHYLDDIYGNSGFLTDTYVTSDNITLDESINNDVYNIVKKKVNENFPNYDENRVTRITNRLVSGNLPGYIDNDTNDIIEDAITVQMDIYKSLASAKADGPSDTYDGATNYLRNIDGDEPVSPSDLSTVTGKGVAGSYQHGNYYYYDHNLKRESQTGARESFATYYSVSIRSDSESYQYYEDYLPTTTEYLNEVIDNMANR